MNSVQSPSTVVVPAGRVCPRCGAPLGGFGPEGLCGACLFDSGLVVGEPVAELDLLSSCTRRFGDYELLEEIARGGMGVIFKARQLSLNRTVAVKMILRGEFASLAELARFRVEAETAARLQHPNIVAIHEVGERDGQPFFSMEYVAGQNLAQLVGNAPLPATRAANYLKTITEAVQYAHQQGVLHRDLKPSNILIDESDQPRITDFGLAKRFSTQDSGLQTPDLTLTGQVLGSPNFMPPEQAAGKNDTIGPASDVYSLGAILYHALTGRPPFVAENVTATLRLLAETEPVSLRLLVPTVPRDLETICLKCLQKEPQRRYATARGLAEELDRFVNDEPIQARSVGRPEKIWRWGRRSPALAGTTALVVALFLVVMIGSPIAVYRINHERMRAEEALKNETVLRKRAEVREKLSLAKALCDQSKFTEAANLLSEVHAPIHQAEAKDALEIFSTLTDAFARAGRWREARTNAVRGIQIQPLDHLLYHSLACLLVASGDLEGYRQHCRRSLAQFCGTHDPAIAERTAKDCLILSTSGVELGALNQWAETGVTLGRTNFVFLPYFQLTKGWVEYRQGNFTNATEWLQQVILAGERPPYRAADAYLLLAMSLQQLKHFTAANTAFAKGADLLNTKMPKLANGDIGKYWIDWIITQALMNEAKTLIEGRPFPETDAFKPTE